MRPASASLALAFAMLLLSGCGGPAPDVPPLVPVAAAPAPRVDVTVLARAEAPDGRPLAAEVQAFPVRNGGLAPMLAQGTDAQGAARFSFREPTELLVRVTAPGGWTVEGARVQVGDAVTADGLTVSDRDVFVPLYRDRLPLSAEHAWSTAAATPGPDGAMQPAWTVVTLPLPDGLEAAYLARLTGARVAARWMDGPQGHVGTLATGLAWDGSPWVVGDETSPAAVGPREATWAGKLPADPPADLARAHLQALLQTGTAVVGDVLFGVEAELTFGGQAPAGLPDDSCGHLALC